MMARLVRRVSLRRVGLSVRLLLLPLGRTARRAVLAGSRSTGNWVENLPPHWTATSPNLSTSQRQPEGQEDGEDGEARLELRFEGKSGCNNFSAVQYEADGLGRYFLV